MGINEYTKPDFYTKHQGNEIGDVIINYIEYEISFEDIRNLVIKSTDAYFCILDRENYYSGGITYLNKLRNRLII